MLLIHVDRGSQNLSLSPEQSSPPGKKVTYVVTTASGDLQSFPRFLLATRHLPFMQLVPVTHATVELQACPAEKQTNNFTFHEHGTIWQFFGRHLLPGRTSLRPHIGGSARSCWSKRSNPCRLAGNSGKFSHFKPGQVVDEK